MQKRGKTALTLVGFAVMLAALLALMASIGARKDGFDIDEFFRTRKPDTGSAERRFRITSPRAAMRTNI